MSKLICLSLLLLALLSVVLCQEQKVVPKSIPAVKTDNVKKQLGTTVRYGQKQSYGTAQNYGQQSYGGAKSYGGHDDDNFDQKINGPNYFKLCYYSDAACTFDGVASCSIVVNGQCNLLPDNDNVQAYAIGNSITALFYPTSAGVCTGAPKITSTTFGSCIALATSGLGVAAKFLPLDPLSTA
jgi:hypothetical protein